MTSPGGQAAANAIDAPGTDEALWRAWPGLRSLPAAALPVRGRVVIVAAHPDDEVLGFGGSISLLAAAGVELTVVSVTDGERSHPGSRVVDPVSLAAIRATETRAALDELGADRARVIRLGVPDTDVAGHEVPLAAKLTGLLRGAALCVAPWTGDLHADHEAAGRAALRAADAAGVPCLLYPVWMWHWARPDDPRVPWESGARIGLPPAALARKASAVERFASQIRPLGPAPEDAAILPPEETAHHLRDLEVVFR
ncbi:PIG-L deacetylase family protein [Streptomyces sp. RKAG293]|uniref:PIG-L deacetylase family protein n=1 Tax=Streptomyces sp. RKAG293 TaxID=2893403 RepID=UPI0020344044|nr:PIG-L deacetylase family protein [Streptomyces sp. RKAG293]MCM2422759.1 PIG-L family deacetylase [Streptomyces sp. RKAG293]